MMFAVMVTVATIVISVMMVVKTIRGRRAESSADATRELIDAEAQTESALRHGAPQTVYVTPRGEKYHLDPKCDGLAKATLGVFPRDACKVCVWGARPKASASRSFPPSDESWTPSAQPAAS